MYPYKDVKFLYVINVYVYVCTYLVVKKYTVRKLHITQTHITQHAKSTGLNCENNLRAYVIGWISLRYWIGLDTTL